AGRRHEPPQPPVVPLVQRSARAAAGVRRGAGCRQTVLGPAMALAGSSVHKTSAWPLALIYTALIVFASLFPFDGWRAQGIDPLVFLLAKIPPPYWTGFDVATNVVGYAPLGFLLVLALLRSGWPRGAVLVATLAGTL